MTKSNYQNTPTYHREIVGAERSKPNGKGLNQKDIVAYIQDHLKIGDRFKAPHDLYNVDRVYLDDMTDKIVIGFYDHYVLTVDDFGKHETFQYFDMYVLLRGQRK